MPDDDKAAALPWMPCWQRRRYRIYRCNQQFPRSRMPPNRPPAAAITIYFTDAFVTAYNPTASDYPFSTYLGGSNYDYATSVAVFTDSDIMTSMSPATLSRLISPPRIPSRPASTWANTMPLSPGLMWPAAPWSSPPTWAGRVSTKPGHCHGTCGDYAYAAGKICSSVISPPGTHIKPTVPEAVRTPLWPRSATRRISQVPC